MAWVTFKSPLWRKEIVQDKVKPLPSLKVKRKMEQEFVNDGVRTTNGTNRRKPIIPPYNALRDRYAQAYFQSPLVKAMKERNFHLKVRNIKSFYCPNYEEKWSSFMASVIKYFNYSKCTHNVNLFSSAVDIHKLLPNWSVFSVKKSKIWNIASKHLGCLSLTIWLTLFIKIYIYRINMVNTVGYYSR